MSLSKHEDASGFDRDAPVPRGTRMKPDRRAVLAGTGALAAAGPAGAAPPPAVTRILAKYLVGAHVGDIPANVRREGCRTLLNYVGVAVGGSQP